MADTKKKKTETITSYRQTTGFGSHERYEITDEIKIAVIKGNWKGAENCESITDKSSFIPNSQLMRKAAREGANAQVFYDFEDGKDDGRKVPVARIKGADIAEISEEIKKEQKDVKAKIDDANAKAQAEAEATARAKASLDAYKKALND